MKGAEYSLSDMIQIFNQLTSNKLADCSYFEDILDTHFFKFRYFYSLIDDVNIKHIDTIDCEIKSSSIVVCITPSENKYINNIIRIINKNKKNDSMTQFFDMNLIESNSKLYIDISLLDLDEEGDIFDDNRFI